MLTIIVGLTSMTLIYPTRAREAPDAAAGDKADLAQELTNPLADLVTIPIQMNYDSGIGHADNGSKLQTNVQPVYPFNLSRDWNLISRTIVPVTYQRDIFPEAGAQFGLGDISLSSLPKPPPTAGDLACRRISCCRSRFEREMRIVRKRSNHAQPLTNLRRKP